VQLGGGRIGVVDEEAAGDSVRMPAARMLRIEHFERVAVSQLEHGEPLVAALSLETEHLFRERDHLVEALGASAKPHDALQLHLTRLDSGTVARKIRVVIAKPGLDGHDRGAKIIARALRDAGMEVIYTGLHQTPEQIVETAIQEDADAVGISILSGAHMTLVPRILDGLKENGADDVLVVVGGTIPREDSDELKQLGVAEVFGPGAAMSEIVDFLKGKVPVT
jgi:methylmalonyl-CoA mutase C-terminal domain/subunit